MRALVTGGCGFIGSTLVNRIAGLQEGEVLNYDVLNYASDPRSVSAVSGQSNYQFVKGDVCDRLLFAEKLHAFKPDVVFHLAAESHVDRSIDGPDNFLNTNVMGTFAVLEAIRDWLNTDNAVSPDAFRFVHVSTDEVYGDLSADEPAFTEHSPYKPSSPYSASKAASDHLAASWARTYQLPVIITNCSNNYGPRQFPEKLIPLMILSALAGTGLPVYGNGQNVRDWLHVEDHVDALLAIARKGVLGSRYNIGGLCERRNIEVVTTICSILDRLVPKNSGCYGDQIEFVTDRSGHDLRYAVDCSKLMAETGWRPAHDFDSGLEQTVQWYLDNEDWWRPHFDKG